MPDVLTDEEIEKLEASFSKAPAETTGIKMPEVVTDEEMDSLEKVFEVSKKTGGATRDLGPEKPTYEERVQAGADVLAQEAQESMEKDPGWWNRIAAPSRQFTGTMTEHFRQAAPYRALGKGTEMVGKTIGAIEGAYEKLPTAAKVPLQVAKTVGRSLPTVGAIIAASDVTPIGKEAIEKVESITPEPVKNLVKIGMDVAELIPAGFFGAKAGGKVTTGGLKTGGKAAKAAAGRVQGTKVKIGTPEFNKGAANKLYTKYGVFGNAKSVKKQWKTKIDAVAKQVREKITKSDTMADPDNYTFVDDIFSQAEKSAEKFGKSKTAVTEIKKELQKLRNTFDEAYPEGKMDLLDTHTEKQFIGKKGDWLAEAGSRSGNPSAPVSAQAHNALYDAMKTVVENKGSPGIKELNKQLSEMIPMERAASKQVLVSNRKNLIPLDDYIGGLAAASSAAHGNLLPAALMVGNIMSKSPLSARGLNFLGDIMEKAGELGETEIKIPKKLKFGPVGNVPSGKSTQPRFIENFDEVIKKSIPEISTAGPAEISRRAENLQKRVQKSPRLSSKDFALLDEIQQYVDEMSKGAIE